MPTPQGMFTNLCPRCNQTAIFRFFSMNQSCRNCGNIYEKEQGYFIGAIIAGYFFSTMLVVPTFLFCIFKLELNFAATAAIAVAQLVVMHPFIFRYGRIFWINLEHKLSQKV